MAQKSRFHNAHAQRLSKSVKREHRVEAALIIGSGERCVNCRNIFPLGVEPE